MVRDPAFVQASLVARRKIPYLSSQVTQAAGFDGMRQAQQRRVTQQELIDCHDCGNGVSFSAAACPHCGSTEPAGPAVQSRRELRRLRIEAANDRRLVVVTALCAGLGILYGAVMGAGGAASLWAALGYGFVGAVIGVPAAFVVNITRGLFD